MTSASPRRMTLSNFRKHDSAPQSTGDSHQMESPDAVHAFRLTRVQPQPNSVIPKLQYPRANNAAFERLRHCIEFVEAFAVIDVQLRALAVNRPLNAHLQPVSSCAKPSSWDHELRVIPTAYPHPGAVLEVPCGGQAPSKISRQKARESIEPKVVGDVSCPD